MRFAGSVATGAGNGGVSAVEREASVTMHRDRVKGAVKIRDTVTGFAPIVQGRRRELIVVDILVAVGAIRKLNLVLCVLAGWNMTLGARDSEVFSFQRIL